VQLVYGILMSDKGTVMRNHGIKGWEKFTQMMVHIVCHSHIFVYHVNWQEHKRNI